MVEPGDALLIGVMNICSAVIEDLAELFLRRLAPAGSQRLGGLEQKTEIMRI